jgi:hypothetical protein
MQCLVLLGHILVKERICVWTEHSLALHLSHSKGMLKAARHAGNGSRFGNLTLADLRAPGISSWGAAGSGADDPDA